MRLFSTFSILCFASILSAQIQKGKIMSEVGFNFSNTVFEYKDNPIPRKRTYLTFNINSTNRYFIKKNVYTSLAFGYSYSSNSSPKLDTLGVQIGSYKDAFKSYNISVGLGALRNLGSKIYIGTDVNVGITTNYRQASSNGISFPEGSNLQYFLNLKPQLYYHFKPKFLIFVDFGQVEYSYESSYGGYEFNSKFNLFFSPRFWNYGFIFLWGKSKEKTIQN